MNKWVLVKGTDVKTINKDTEKLVAEPGLAAITKNESAGTAAVQLTFDGNSNATDTANGPISAISAKFIRTSAGVTDGTWYLAVAEVTYKVKQVHEDAVAASEGVAAKAEVKLLVEETGIKVTKIASKTPIVKETAQS